LLTVRTCSSSVSCVIHLVCQSVTESVHTGAHTLDVVITWTDLLRLSSTSELLRLRNGRHSMPMPTSDLQICHRIEPKHSSKLTTPQGDVIIWVEAWMTSNWLHLNPDWSYFTVRSALVFSCVVWHHCDLRVVINVDLMTHIISVWFLRRCQLCSSNASSLMMLHASWSMCWCSPLDYCNNLFAGLPACQLIRLQSVTKVASRIVLIQVVHQWLLSVYFCTGSASQSNWPASCACWCTSVRGLAVDSLVQHCPSISGTKTSDSELVRINTALSPLNCGLGLHC